LPGCLVTLSGKQSSALTAGQDGRVRFAAVDAKDRYNVAVSKPGYEGNTLAVQFRCGEEKTVELPLRVRPTMLRLRTFPPQCEILINGQPKGPSDAQGNFSLQVIDATLKIEARKEGYLGVTKGLLLEPGKAEQQVALTLEPILPLLTVVVTPDSLKDSAKVRVGQQTEQRAVNEEIALAPGRHQLTVEALGHKPVTLEVNLPPGAKEKRSVKLERLPLAELAAQAEVAYQARAYANVLKLCGYMFEADAAYAPAHRLAGLTYVIEQNYATAGDHLARARGGGETFSLPVRRHLREDFDPARGHDLCQALLVFSRERVNFKGLQVGTEDFNVPYHHLQMLRQEPRGRGKLALALSAEVTLENGRKRPYSFFSPDTELSAAGKAYLEMLQRLLQAH
jgi:hypothetical protein